MGNQIITIIMTTLINIGVVFLCFLYFKNKIKNKVNINDYLKHESELHRRVDETHTRISDIQQELIEEIKKK